MSRPGATLRDMKIRMIWEGGRWKAHGDGDVIAFGRTLEATFRDLDDSIDVGVKYRGLHPNLKKEPRDAPLPIDARVSKAIGRQRIAEAAFQRAEYDVQIAMAESVLALIRTGMGLRDIAQIVGRSRSRVQEIAAANLPRGTESVRSTGQPTSLNESPVSG